MTYTARHDTAGAARLLAIITLVAFALLACARAGAVCRDPGTEPVPGVHQIAVQVLGSGGPELDDGRASASYLIWVDGHARLLVDAGPGSSVNFGASGARLEDLWALLFTHFHVDHAADLPALVKGAYFTRRNADLLVYGPDGNDMMPATDEFLQALFGARGAFRYLGDYLEPGGEDSFMLLSENVPLTGEPFVRQTGPSVRVSAAPVHHGPIAAVSWRVDVGSCSLVFTGDASARSESLPEFAAGADLLVIHNAVPEIAEGAALALHMRPSDIGRIAKAAGAGRLLLSHRMKRSIGRERETLSQIRSHYTGPAIFAEEMQRIELVSMMR
jgi:ribonuclease BN (tRNA processing enzyme)